ncbi:s41 family peptidase [Plasmopara halstedii]|uniref:S41 family peptidase n=1 Tax=Plasmopara halstedii TaxID=4781 RepID=A0A0P1AQW6_PLAHL|nr:s41 family peptidase [Plasmopara halstedii]CEG43956.1 s41 family peptidase [Plasmopara halstedii]|eukprot:XP_024580325.1 s41 family peptidase [Plasmopara halstedii]
MLMWPWRLDWLLIPDKLMQLLIMRPLELYEAVAILPVSFLRRHVPVLGGALVVLMTLHGILVRLFLELLRAIFARVTYSRDPVLTFQRFWRAMQDNYAFLEPRRVDWQLVRQLFGDTIQPTTSDDDLWIALQESVCLCDDSSIVVSRVAGANSGVSGPRTATVRGHKLFTVAAMRYQQMTLATIEREHLTQGGRRIANNRFVCGILNAATSPGWRIGYICLTAMEGFVEFPLPRVDTLMPSWSRGAKFVGIGADQMLLDKSEGSQAGSPIAVPEIYDLESMRWSLEAILLGLGNVDGLILDLRFNQGGGSHVAALTIASFFASESKAALAFTTDEKLPGAVPNFSKRKKYYIPYTSRCTHFRGPLAVLQSQYTRGTAELLCLSIMKRPLTSRIGGTTAGSLSATRQLRLPNYWTVDIPHQRVFSIDDVLYEGVGIPPTEFVPDMEQVSAQMVDGNVSIRQTTEATASSSAFDPCIRKAIDYIMDVESTRDT